MKRNRNIEAMRGIAILLMLFYHYAQIVPQILQCNITRVFDEATGQIAVMLFLTISGFGTYLYFDKQTIIPTSWTYLKRRIKGLAPQYYFCMIIILLTTGTGYLARDGVKYILTVATFTHNLFPDTNGAINGVTWTIGLIVQFYFIAAICYKAIRKWGGVYGYI